MKFLFCSLGSHGFVYPSVGIALALKRRGHEIAFVTNQTFHETLCSFGIERIPRGTKDGDSFQVHLWFRELAIAIQVKHVEYAIDAFQPDVLVGHQLALGPFLAAERRTLPIASLGLAAYLFPTHPAHTPFATGQEKYEWRYQDMLGHYNRARLPLNMRPWPNNLDENPFLGDVFLLQSLPRLEPRRQAFPAKVRFVGSCLWDPPCEPDQELANWVSDAVAHNRPILYAQPGRSFEHEGFWPHLVNALADMDVCVVADTARMDKAAEVASERFLIRPHTTHSHILPYVRGVISSGHTTSVLGAAAYGLPSLLIPSGSGAEEIAENFRNAQSAMVIHCQTADAASIKSAVERLLHDDSLRQSARSLQKSFQETNGCERSADAIEQLGDASAGVAFSRNFTFEAEEVFSTAASLSGER